MNSNLIVEMVRLTEADIETFEARMREVPPTFQPGDRVELHGEEFEVASFHQEGMPGRDRLLRLVPAVGPSLGSSFANEQRSKSKKAFE